MVHGLNSCGASVAPGAWRSLICGPAWQTIPRRRPRRWPAGLSPKARRSHSSSRCCRHHAVMALQVAAQRLQACAQCLQWSISCFAHSAPQVSQAVAQRVQTALTCSPLRPMDAAARRQISAHSRSSEMHRTIDCGSSSFRHAVAHWRQAAAHSLHARRQSISF